MSHFTDRLSRIARNGQILDRARELVQPLPPLPEDLLERAAQALPDQRLAEPERPPTLQPHQMAELELVFARRLTAALEAEHERTLGLLAQMLEQCVEPLLGRVEILEHDLLQARGLIAEYRREQPKPRIRVPAKSRRSDVIYKSTADGTAAH